MRSRSNTWITLASQGDFNFDAKAYIGDKVYTKISAPQIDRPLMTNPLSVGNCISATLNLSILTDDIFDPNVPIVIKGRLYKGSTVSEFLPFGTFFINQRTAQSGLVSVSCYDAMLKASKTYVDGGSEANWPKPMIEVVEEIASRIGVSVDDRTAVNTGDDYMVPYPNQLSMLQVLGYIGACHGGNWVITEENKLRLIPLVTSPDETSGGINVPVVLGQITAGRSVTVTAIVAEDSEGNSYTAGDSTGAKIDLGRNPYVTQAICDDLLERYAGLVYSPYTASKAVYDPAAELGDQVVIGDEVSSVIMDATLTLDTAFHANISAPNSEELSAEYPYLSEVSRLQQTAAAAQSTADTAKANAAAAQAAADSAQNDVNALADRVTAAETNIVKNSDTIALMATKTEVTEALNGYYTKTETDSKFQVEADEITSSVSKAQTTADNAAAAAAAAQSTADTAKANAATAQAAADGLEIGGRNLLLNSSFAENLTNWSNSGASIVTLDGVACAAIVGEFTKTKAVSQNVLSKLDVNDLTQTYVFSADVRIDDYVAGSTNPYVKLYFSGSYGSWLGATTVKGNPDIPTQAAGKWVRLSWVVKFTKTPTSMTLYIYARDFTGNLYFKNLKLEKGNRETDWTPAPEDMATEAEVTELSTRVSQTEANIVLQASSIDAHGERISKVEQTADSLTVSLQTTNENTSNAQTTADNAAKTATNYLNYSNSGLIVGNMAASTLGRNILISDSNVDIRNGSSVLATYADNLIQLGKNSTSSVIELCGAKGKIGYNASDFWDGNHLTMEADSIIHQGADMAVLMADNSTGTRSYVQVLKNSVQLATVYQITDDDGEVVIGTTAFDVSQGKIYGLGDSITLISRNGMILDDASGNITTSARLNADGGIRLANGRQIIGGTSIGTDIAMVQMDASNYIMFGYGSYANKIGATYLDGNAVYIRSNSTITLTGTVSMGSSLTVTDALNANGGIVLPNAVAIKVKNSTGTALGALSLDSSDNLIIGGGLYNNASGKTYVYGGVGAELRIPGDGVGVYASTTTTYSAFFRPNTTGKCTLGSANYRWYRVYASNSSIDDSDRRLKENIIPLGESQVMTYSLNGDEMLDIHSELFDRLNPVQFTFIDGDSRIRYGLIAQEVVAAMEELGISEDDLDLVHHDTWIDEETNEARDTYGMAYTNLIALLIHEVQKLKSEVNMLKAS